MGAWGYGLAQSDDAYDFLAEINDFLPFDAHLIIQGDELDRKMASTEMRKHEEEITRLVENEHCDFASYAMLYAGLLSNLGIELNNTQKELFELGYKAEMEEIDKWDEPEERRTVMDNLKRAIETNTPYSFNDKGLFDTIAEGMRKEGGEL